MSTQVLVTGGTGFIGRHLVEALLEDGHPVRMLARNPAKARRLFADRVQIVEGHLLDAASLAAACEGMEVIYHVGGLYRFGPGHAAELKEVNVEGTRRLLAAAVRCKPRIFVHVSSAGVLQSEQSLATEADLPAKRPHFSPYKASKWDAEQVMLQAVADGFPAVLTSPTCPIGAGDEEPTPTGAMVKDFLEGRFPFLCHTGLNFIGVEDVARGLMAAARRGRPGGRYILGNKNLYLAEFLALVGREAGIPIPRRTLPWPVILGAGLVAEAGGKIGITSQKNLCLETVLQARRIQFLDNSLTRQELNWAPQEDLSSSIRHAVEWFREQAGTR
jgi:dihydroflavonol-4-reductase